MQRNMLYGDTDRPNTIYSMLTTLMGVSFYVAGFGIFGRHKILCEAPTQDYHSYTHALLGGVEEEYTSPSSSRVRLQENTELLSVCGLKGTPQRVSMPGLGGKGCSFGVHSVDVEDVGLRLPLLAESQLVVCVISAAYFSTALDCTSSP